MDLAQAIVAWDAGSVGGGRGHRWCAVSDRLFRGGDADHDRSRAGQFDPIAEGKRFGLSPEVSTAIWDSVSREATNHGGVCDEVLVRERFLQVAKRIAARGGRLGPAPFKWTQVDVASGINPGNGLADPVPSKTILVAASSRAWTGLGRAPGRTTQVDGPVDAEVCTPEDSRGFFRRYLNGGHAAKFRLDRAIASRDPAAALMAVAALQQDLEGARRHLANGIAHDEGLERELAALAHAAEPLVATLARVALRAQATMVYTFSESAEHKDDFGPTTSDETDAADKDASNPPDGYRAGARGEGDSNRDHAASPPARATDLRAMASGGDFSDTRAGAVAAIVPAEENPVSAPEVGGAAPTWIDAWAHAIAGQDRREGREHSTGSMAMMPFRPRGAAMRSARIDHRVGAPSSSAAVMRSAERTEIDPAAAELVTRARRGGAPLDALLKSRLEAALGTQLDGVRVHTDAEADAAARALGARAFAISDDVFFSAGAYDPQRRDGQQLIAHEVAHTVQARGASTPTDAMTVSQPGDATELEADAFADAFVREVGAGGDAAAVSPHGEANTPESLARSPQNGGGLTLREHAGSSIHLHPVEKVLKFAAKWLLKHETKTLTKHIAKHARGIAGKAIHSIFKHPKKIKALVEGAVKEATELAAKHATKPVTEAIEEGGIRVVRQATGTPGKVRWVVQKTFKDAIGTQGERILRIVIDQSGRIVSAFPSDRLIAIGLGLGAVEILGERSADAAEKVHNYAERDAAKEDSWSLWDFVPVIGDIWGGELNSGEDEELRRGRELTKDIQDAIAAVEAEEGRTLGPDERKVVEETFRAAIGAPLLDEKDGE